MKGNRKFPFCSFDIFLLLWTEWEISSTSRTNQDRLRAEKMSLGPARPWKRLKNAPLLCWVVCRIQSSVLLLSFRSRRPKPGREEKGMKLGVDLHSIDTHTDRPSRKFSRFIGWKKIDFDTLFNMTQRRLFWLPRDECPIFLRSAHKLTRWSESTFFSKLVFCLHSKGERERPTR